MNFFVVPEDKENCCQENTDKLIEESKELCKTKNVIPSFIDFPVEDDETSNTQLNIFERLVSLISENTDTTASTSVSSSSGIFLHPDSRLLTSDLLKTLSISRRSSITATSMRMPAGWQN